jgi:hypothetical protein
MLFLETRGRSTENREQCAAGLADHLLVAELDAQINFANDYAKIIGSVPADRGR